MGKAILILDEMPKNCDECPFINGIWCMPIRTEIENPFDEIMKECPLKPLPKKIARAFDIDKSFIDGYNYCLDTLLGEE